MLTGVPDQEWSWDETLNAGSAPHYVAGRMPYPPALARAIADAVGLDGSGRLLDVGCGPGALTLLLAPHVAEAVGVDADAGMLEQAARLAQERGVRNVSWHRLRAEELPAALGTFRVVTFAQSFHWMDQALVAEHVREHARTGRRLGARQGHHPPGRTRRRCLSPPPGPRGRRSAGWSRPTSGRRRGRDRACCSAAQRRGGRDARRRLPGPPAGADIEQGQVVRRGVDEVVSAVFSLSGSAPHLFGPRLVAFEDDLPALLRQALAGRRLRRAGGGRRRGDLALLTQARGTCWVMQWTLPPPSRISRPGTRTTRRPGKSAAYVASGRARRAGRRAAGTTTTPVADVEVHVGAGHPLARRAAACVPVDGVDPAASCVGDRAAGRAGAAGRPRARRPRASVVERSTLERLRRERVLRVGGVVGPGQDDDARARRSAPGCRRGRRSRRGATPAREPDDLLQRRGGRRGTASISARVRSGLRLGLSRHSSVVSTVPSPSTSIEPPSSTSGGW